MVELKRESRCFTREDLDVFNIISQPLWIFDIENKAMWWANTAGLAVWNADSLEELLSRNYADDMSEATSQRLADYYVRFQNGEKIKDQWTYYPNGEGPKTLHVTHSGILIDNGRLAMLNEAVLPLDGIDQTTLRGVEMLRHLPVAVCQFDIDGNVMHQNPEALDLFGNPVVDSSIHAGRANGRQQNENNTKNDCHFMNLFVDKELGSQLLAEIKRGNDCCIEAKQHTKLGARWYAIEGRQGRDPVTGSPIILYSARDITELVEVKKEAERANDEKSEFMAVMGHEIRTPLHQVIGTIELLSQSNVDDEQAENIRLLRNGATSLMTIINDLLDYTKLEAGKMKLENVVFDVSAVAGGCLAAVSTKAEEKGLILNQNLKTTGIPTKLMGDPNRLRQILLNLLHNAVKFTPQGSVTLTLKRLQDDKSGRVVLCWIVTDTGIGISKEHQKDQIFRKYQQADDLIAQNYGGTGLGLAICKILAENMGGRIGVESEVGKGSTFWLELPYEQQQSIVSANDSDYDARAESLVDDHSENSNCILNVLVAEDNVVNQKIQARMLKRLGHMVTVVDNGQKAVDIIDEGNFDLVLMDVQMPVLDGIEATKQIRCKGWSTSHLPVIGLSASYRTSERQFYQDIGMNLCMSKPLQFKVLKNVIGHYSRPWKLPQAKGHKLEARAMNRCDTLSWLHPKFIRLTDDLT